MKLRSFDDLKTYVETTTGNAFSLSRYSAYYRILYWDKIAGCYLATRHPPCGKGEVLIFLVAYLITRLDEQSDSKRTSK